jgi:DNA topoisomerase-2
MIRIKRIYIDEESDRTHKMADLSKQYRKHSHREHILSLPDTYIGSIENSAEEFYVVNGEAFEAKTVNPFNPGFYKLFDELLVNAHDHVVRLRERKSDNLVKHIDISVKDNAIVIKNDGESIDVEKHPEYGVYIPQMIFGELLTSTNYDKTEKKLVGGKNGYGVKLVNIFAKKLTITIVDGKRQQKYVQVFEDNMTKIREPTIKSCKTKPFVELEWVPDFARFGWKDATIPDGLLQVIQRRVFDLAMTVGKEVRVTWCDTPIKFRDLASYASWYLPKDAPVVTDIPQTGWQIAISDSPTDKAFNVSFVNGIWTRSGKHVDEITNQVVAHIVNYLETKKKIKVKPSLVKDSIGVFIHCFVENPSFSSQTKEVLTTKVSCKLSEDVLKKIVAKLNIVSKVLEQQNVKDNKENTKTDGKKSSKISGIPKLDDAVYAGTTKSHECVLILTEGDSAKAMALSGLSQEQRKYYGVFPLKGKLLNVKDTSVRKVEQTEEIANLKKIVGLESGKEYKDVKSLRYGRILIMTDQDYDGSHIRGLLINMFHELWHELIKVPGFITYMATPIVKATKGKQTKSFYTQYEYEEWRKTSASSSWKVKYYKGLGTSTRDEAKEYFKSLNIVQYAYDVGSDKSIDLAFNKAKADDRKDWLKTYSRCNIIDPAPGENVSYEDFVNKDLIHFSNYNLERSIPNVMDGLKTSQRKILYSAFKRNLKTEIRVAQFAGYVSEHSGYHHGEQSLNDAIVGMAQDFVGSNNIAWLTPAGQFGTRLQGGKDSASPRYIHTHLQPYIQNLVPTDDFDCLTFRDDDGTPVEPEWYAPILPMLLINGCRGIGTGYSTFIPSFNPSEIKSAILEWLEKGSGLNREFAPYTRGFKGVIQKIDKQDYLVQGVWKIEKDTAVITELPVGTWTSDFRETLDKLVADGSIKDYTDTSTDTDILIKVKLGTGGVPTIEKILTDKIKLTNMHAFNSKCVIKKYDSPNQILNEFVGVRLELYAKRREFMLNALKQKLPYHRNVVRFILQQCELIPVPDIRRKTAEECDSLLAGEKFDKIKDSYDYLMNLPIASLTLKMAKKHQDDLDELIRKIAELEAKGPSQMWREELQNLPNI